jgi:hypothetical protein
MSEIELPQSKSDLSDDELRLSLNNETGKLSWDELARHFARGVVIKVANSVDLVEVALKFARDDRQAVEVWLTSGEVAKATDEDALHWHQNNATFWAVVSAPFVLVQEISAEQENASTH